ncbi:MotA/TolQ/ExbB proton channel family protein [Sphingobium boeckii]|uniref:Chemotaxis protein MotA n=1 Tax=Sphingobium boeckii TaxID=1082345 RepID=A0A7W9EFX3_9SPHN|nr:MotA/TolQ/ExbB proton channel family protein [Sphingobium boeckii]MBB5686465.1 chemotaxis protein MotA [Sphingobium boeckii]
MAMLEKLAQLADFTSFLLVFAGTMLVVLSRFDRAGLSRAFAAFGPLFSAAPEQDEIAAMRAVRLIERIAEARSIACADRVETAQRFLRLAARRLSDATSAAAFTRWVEEELEDRRRRHAIAIDFWTMAAETAPAMGMIGTIIGLVFMFAAMDDAAAIGGPMALAMLTTLYGIIIANLIALPIARRLERLSAHELAWQRRALDHLETLAVAELEAKPVAPVPKLRVAQ